MLREKAKLTVNSLVELALRARSHTFPQPLSATLAQLSPNVDRTKSHSDVEYTAWQQ
jgi:hypothetical protein